MSREDYISRLNSYLANLSPSVRYDKNSKEVSQELFQILIERVDVAIENAKVIDNGSWKPV